MQPLQALLGTQPLKTQEMPASRLTACEGPPTSPTGSYRPNSLNLQPRPPPARTPRSGGCDRPSPPKLAPNTRTARPPPAPTLPLPPGAAYPAGSGGGGARRSGAGEGASVRAALSPGGPGPGPAAAAAQRLPPAAAAPSHSRRHT
jgi:hypothetical protein